MTIKWASTGDKQPRVYHLPRSENYEEQQWSGTVVFLSGGGEATYGR